MVREHSVVIQKWGSLSSEDPKGMRFEPQTLYGWCEVVQYTQRLWSNRAIRISTQTMFSQVLSMRQNNSSNSHLGDPIRHNAGNLYNASTVMEMGGSPALSLMAQQIDSMYMMKMVMVT